MSDIFNGNDKSLLTKNKTSLLTDANGSLHITENLWHSLSSSTVLNLLPNMYSFYPLVSQNRKDLRLKLLIFLRTFNTGGILKLFKVSLSNFIARVSIN